MPDAVAAPLSGRAVLVTGGSSGIGRAIALESARAGANVLLTYRKNEAGARDVEREIAALSRRAMVRQVDIGDAESLGRFARIVRDEFGPVHAWVNNAGADILTGQGEALSTIDKLDLLLRVDLRGTMLASWVAVELLGSQPEGGVIVNMSWDHVAVGMAGTNPQLFAAVKGGVLAFSKALARSAAPAVRVNVVAPGWIETSFGAGVDEMTYRAVADSTPLRRWGTPEDVANAVVFLASPAAAFITGETIYVGGGLVM